ncbi:hypothetical protein MNBD_GAMMA09-27 [hydrothermal vent metagenome]|uniref:Sulfatase N-terminal domain-containing protein n=1 Tax=hydrothermal vent metagenome TaxID=652676 RepID=A0A3B0XLS5_9ZZZZ
MKCILNLSWLFVLSFFCGMQAQAASNNILVIVADDLGVDMLPAVYTPDCSVDPASCEAGGIITKVQTTDIKTDSISALAQGGITFNNVWSNPQCSPTRATIQTGRYGYKTGVDFASKELPLNETTLPELLRQAGYASAAIGKWHLGTADPAHPTKTGYDYFSGTLAGAVTTSTIKGGLKQINLTI